MHVNANPRKCQNVVQPPGLTTNQQQWLEAWQHLRTHARQTATHFRYHFVSALTYTYERYFCGAFWTCMEEILILVALCVMISFSLS